MQIGIGTYSFGGLESMFGLGPTLEEKFLKIKELGYDSVELLERDLAVDTEDIKRWAAAAGIAITSVHAKPTEEVIRKMAELGGRAVIWPSAPFSNREEAAEVAGYLEEMAAVAEPFGIKVGYHNHSQEFFFDEGKALLEHLLDAGSGFYAQLDCGWAQNGGMYPPYFIRKYRDRIISIHVKENCRVSGPGGRPASSHAERPARPPMPDISSMTVEERRAALEELKKRFEKKDDGKPALQCRMGAPESNMNWQDIKDALDEQSFEAFWVVEREDFYDEREACLADDCKYLRENVK